MADVKISGLPASTTPLAGTEVLPVVQSGQTKQVSIDNVTAGRSTSALNFIPSGSVAPTNGVYLPAANSVGIAANSVEMLRVDTVGTTVKRDASTGANILTIENTSTSGVATKDITLRFLGRDTVGGAKDRAYIRSANADGGNIGNAALSFFTRGSDVVAERMRIFAAGGVSIGNTTDPGAGSLRVNTVVQSGATPRSLTTDSGNVTSAAVRTIMYKAVVPAASSSITIDIPLSDFDYVFPTQFFRVSGTVNYFIGTRDVGLSFQPLIYGKIALTISGASFNAVREVQAPVIDANGMTGCALTISISSGNLRFALSNTFPTNFGETHIKIFT